MNELEWKSVAMILIGFGSGVVASVLFGLSIIFLQRRALTKGKHGPS